MATNFDRTFEELTRYGAAGQQPFGWQKRLFRELVDGYIPSALDLPTGLGKTSTMIVWLIARAVNPRLPRRLVYVVDRRAVVDQATAVAEMLRRNMPVELKTALGIDGSLPVSPLRGRLADNREWLSDPSSPAIIVGTVDMIGSRLLFSGYGVSPWSRPVHAALLGSDSLIVLDEAHLNRPFQRLLESLRLNDDLWPEQTPAGRLQVMSLSATGASSGSGTIFALTPAEREEPGPRQRLSAKKALTVEDAEEKPVEALFLAVRRLLSEQPGPTRLVVFVTGREEAVKLAGLVADPKKGLANAKDVHLLTGARRGAERDRIARDLEEAGFIAGAARSERSPVLVATAAGEVGIDLDADHMVADLASWERMVQRLGRVNRRGIGEAVVRVVDLAGKGMGLGRTPADREAELTRRAATRALLAALPALDDGAVSAGPAALESAGPPEAVAAASTPEPLRPEVSLPLVEAWSMTSLRSHAGRPEVGPWLRGWVEEEPQATLAWRHHLPVVRQDGEEDRTDPEEVARFFFAAPLGTAELLEMSAAQALKVLAKHAARIARFEPRRVIGLLLDGKGALRSAVRARDLSEGRIAGERDAASALGGGRLVLDAALGGLDSGLLSDRAEDPPVVADQPDDWAALHGDDLGEVRWEVRLRQSDEAKEDRIAFRLDMDLTRDGEPRKVLEVRRLGAVPSEAASWISSTPVLLADHEQAVEREARRLAERLGLDAAEAMAVARAGVLHDHGKASELWQRRMGAPEDAIYAKTTGRGGGASLEGYRHEFGSLLAAEREDLPGETRDLILHLVAAHHGRARPLISTANVQAARDGAFGLTGTPPTEAARAARDAALRFARLQKRYGPWGLAWREEILRAADRAASAREAERERD